MMTLLDITGSMAAASGSSYRYVQAGIAAKARIANDTSTCQGLYFLKHDQSGPSAELTTASGKAFLTRDWNTVKNAIDGVTG
jgi:hypothetical protein